jgi:hypothetical protein
MNALEKLSSKLWLDPTSGMVNFTTNPYFWMWFLEQKEDKRRDKQNINPG